MCTTYVFAQKKLFKNYTVEQYIIMSLTSITFEIKNNNNPFLLFIYSNVKYIVGSWTLTE